MNLKKIKDSARISDAEVLRPKNQDELRSIIAQRVGVEGYDADLNDIDVSAITDMTALFLRLESRDMWKKFNGKIDKWDVSNVVSMHSMFRGCESFNQPLNTWNVSRVEDMAFMFDDCNSFNQPLDNWDVSNVTDMQWMFGMCVRFNQPLNTWDVSRVRDTFAMFKDCVRFNRPLENWDVSSVTDMRWMFMNCKRFNQSLDNWKVSKRARTKEAFEGAKIAPSWSIKAKQDSSWIPEFLEMSKGMPYDIGDYCKGKVEAYVIGYVDKLPSDANEWMKAAYKADQEAEELNEDRHNPSWDVGREALYAVCEELGLKCEEVGAAPESDDFVITKE